MDKAAAGLVVSQASLEEVRLQLGLRVVQTYGDWLSAHLKTLANEKSLATHVRLREQVKRRLTEGASAQSDLVLAVARLEGISADVTAARAQGEIALARLGQLLGSPVDGLALTAVLASPRALNGGAQALLERAIGINPTVTKAQAQARVQEAVIEERRADLMPEVYVRIELWGRVVDGVEHRSGAHAARSCVDRDRGAVAHGERTGIGRLCAGLISRQPHGVDPSVAQGRRGRIGLV
jgi:outer membrane protein, adhesin transport system